MSGPPEKANPANLPCEACGAQCCRYVGVGIDRPRTKREFDTIRWYLLHENIHVYIDHENDWYIEFQTECENLLPDGACREYADRPQICRDHGWPAGSCEYFADPHRRLFRTVADFETYLGERGIDWRWKRRPRVDREGEAQ